MRIYHTPVIFEKQTYFLNGFLGCLLSRSQSQCRKKNKYLPEEIVKILESVLNPYKLQKKINCNKFKANKLLEIYAHILVFLCEHSFFLARLVAKINIPVFQNTTEAVLAFREIIYYKSQSDLCLPRSLFAASTSKSFKSNGAILIGVFLPSSSMHAWIIENNNQPDPYDAIWINFQPIAILSYAK